MLGFLIKTLFKMIVAITRRGRGIFKFLFAIDDFFRIFTMTLLIPIFFTWIKMPDFVVVLGFILGVVIDVQDFMAEMGIRKMQ